MSSFHKIAIFHNLPGGGSVRYLKNIYRHLIKNNKVEVFSIKETKNTNINISGKDEIKIIKPWKTFLGRNLWIILKLPQIHKKMAEKINNKNYSLTIVNHDYFTKAPYILKYIKKKKVYVLQEPQREFYEPWKIHAPYLKDKIANIFRLFIKLIDIKNTKFADLIICNSKYSQKIIKEIYKKDAQIVYPGVDIKKFKPIKNCKKKKQILLVGGWSKTKGHDFVIKSIGKVLEEYRVIIVGSGRKKEKNNITNLAGKYGDKITWLEKITDSKLIKLYQESILLCAGYFREPFGMTSIESQSCGTPVIGINEGGIKETIIDQKTGFLSPRDEKKYKKCIIEAIKDNKKLSLNARKNAVKNWGWDRSFKNLDKLIK